MRLSYLLHENPERYSIFPIKRPDVWKMVKQAEASVWFTGEVDLGSDLLEIKRLTRPEVDFLLSVLSFFLVADGIVNENLARNFLQEVQLGEVRQFYAIQIFIEAVHQEMYGLLIDSYEPDESKKQKLFNAWKTSPAIKEKMEWCETYFDASLPFLERLVAFACVEGIFFSSSFCAIFWFKKSGRLPGLTFSNELISRDEGLHCDFACLLFNMIDECDRPSHGRVASIVRSAVDFECEFVHQSLRTDLIGMNKNLMCEYVQFCADRLLVALDQDKIFNVANPFDWMELISLQGKTNFFEKRVGEYQKAGVMHSRKFDVSEDF